MHLAAGKLTLVTGLALVAVVISVIGLFGDQDTVNSVLSIVKDVGPDASEQTAREPLEALVKNAMAEDFSWDASAREYATLYRKALKARSGR